MNIPAVDLNQFILATSTLIGLVNGVTFALDRNWRAFVLFLIAGIAGLIFGALHWYGLPSAEIGLALGVGSSGVYKLFQIAGVKR